MCRVEKFAAGAARCWAAVPLSSRNQQAKGYATPFEIFGQFCDVNNFFFLLFLFIESALQIR